MEDILDDKGRHHPYTPARTEQELPNPLGAGIFLFLSVGWVCIDTTVFFSAA